MRSKRENKISTMEVRDWLRVEKDSDLHTRISFRGKFHVMHNIRLQESYSNARNAYKGVTRNEIGVVKTKARHRTMREYMQKRFEERIIKTHKKGTLEQLNAEVVVGELMSDTLDLPKIELIKYLRNLANRLERNTITKSEARDELDKLIKVPAELLEKHNLTILHHDYGIYQLREKGEYLREDTEQGCHDRAWDIIEKSK